MNIINSDSVLYKLVNISYENPIVAKAQAFSPDKLL